MKPLVSVYRLYKCDPPKKVDHILHNLFWGVSHFGLDLSSWEKNLLLFCLKPHWQPHNCSVHLHSPTRALGVLNILKMSKMTKCKVEDTEVREYSTKKKKKWWHFHTKLLWMVKYLQTGFNVKSFVVLQHLMTQPQLYSRCVYWHGLRVKLTFMFLLMNQAPGQVKPNHTDRYMSSCRWFYIKNSQGITAAWGEENPWLLQSPGIRVCCPLCCYYRALLGITALISI